MAEDNTDQEKAGEDSKDFDDPVDLKRSERWLSGLFGIVFSAGGIGAVFISGNQAGTVALVIVGGGLLFMAVVGTPVLHAKYGDKEIHFARKKGKEIAKAIANEPKGVAERAIDALFEVDPIAAAEVARIRHSIEDSALFYELRVKSSLGRLLAGFRVTNEMRDSRGLGIDYVIDKNPGRVAVEIKYRRQPNRLDTTVIRHLFGTLSVIEPLDRLILISNIPLTSSAKAMLRDADKDSKIRFVLWRNEEDNSALAAALEM